MYLKDKEHRVTIRLNDRQFKFLKQTAKELDVRPSEFMRMVVASTMAAVLKFGKMPKIGIEKP
jgi:predicted DNA binding CopG/RHH family protein